MIRYVITFPPNGEITQRTVAEFQDRLRECINDHQYRDVVLANGATMVDLAPRRAKTAAIVRRARALHR